MEHHTFDFAGFTWPRKVADMACGHAALRAKRELRKVCGGYTHAPHPNSNDGRGFYLTDAGQPAPRFEYAEDIIPRAGSYSHDDGWTSFRGIVLRLPHGRFLAGWTMGERMASAVESRVFDDEREAARYADGLAEKASEDDATYQAEEDERIDHEEREATLNDEG